MHDARLGCRSRKLFLFAGHPEFTRRKVSQSILKEFTLPLDPSLRSLTFSWNVFTFTRVSCQCIAPNAISRAGLSHRFTLCFTFTVAARKART